MRTKCNLKFLLFFVIFSHNCFASDLFQPSLTLIYDGNRFDDEDFTKPEDKSLATEWRRIRFGVESQPIKNIQAEISTDYDYEDKIFEFKDVYIAYELTQMYSITLGQFKEASSLEDQLSLRHQWFLERSIATEAFTFGRNQGLMLESNDSNWTLSLAGFLLEKDEDTTSTPSALVGRTTITAYEAENTFLHLGLGLSYRTLAQEKHKLDVSFVAPQFKNDIESKNRLANELISAHQEVAIGYKSILWQFEIYQQEIHKPTYTQAHYTGFYSSLGWTVFGENPRYKRGGIKFDAENKPALRAAIRYSQVDFTADGVGDEGHVITSAINYYINRNFKFMVEYAKGEILSFDKEQMERRKADSTNLRIQIDF